MPIRVKLLSDMGLFKIPMELRIFAKQFPMMLPMKRVGAKIPPTPPDPKVKQVAKILNTTNPDINPMIIQVLDVSRLKKFVFRA
jgi:hypothetical protein